MQILKIIALLIEYPDELLWDNREEALPWWNRMRPCYCRLRSST